MLLNCGVGKDSWESLLLQRDQTSPSYRRSVLGVHWNDWCCSWDSNTLATWCEELTQMKRPSCWARLRAGGEGDEIGWDGWVASPTQWTWVWLKSRSWWWTGRPGLLQFMGSQKVRHDWATKLNWIDCLESLPLRSHAFFNFIYYRIIINIFINCGSIVKYNLCIYSKHFPVYTNLSANKWTSVII